MIDTLGCLLIEASDELNDLTRVGERSSFLQSGREAGRSVGASPDTSPQSRSLNAPSATSGEGRRAASTAADPRTSQTAAMAQRSFGGKPLVDWVLRRASEAELLREIVVILPSGGGLESFKEGLPSGISVFESSQPDSLARIGECLQAFPAKGIVNLRLDSPLLDPCLVDRLLSSVSDDATVDYATYWSEQRDGESRIHALMHAQLGLFAEYFRADVLQQLDQQLDDGDARQSFSAHVRSHPEEFSLRLISLPRALDRDDLRLSLRHQDDWDHAEQIVDALGSSDLDWQAIVALLQSQPHLRRRMADLNLADVGHATR